MFAVFCINNNNLDEYQKYLAFGPYYMKIIGCIIWT